MQNNQDYSIPVSLQADGQKTKPYIIAIEGPNGVGKTTLCKKLNQKEVIDYQLGVPEQWMKYEMKKRMIFEASWMSSAFYFISGTMEVKKKLKNEEQNNDIVMDRSFWSTLAVNWVQDHTRMRQLLPVLSKVSNFLPKPDLTIILIADYTICEQRINSKTDKGKKFDKVRKNDFLQEMEFYEWLNTNLNNTIKLDTSDLNSNEVFEKVYSIINRRLEI